MDYIGEFISLGVAVSWTATAILGEIATKHLGTFTLNIWRMLLVLVFSSILLLFTTGSPLLLHADTETWMWLLLSGIIGYVIGDFCLFNSYIIIGSQYGQLFMTIAPMMAAFTAWISIGQTLSIQSVIAMVVTLTGIAVSITSRNERHRFSLKLPLKGVLYGIGAGTGQGVGLVISKIGMDHYQHCNNFATGSLMEQILPFSANAIRCIAGLIGYATIMYFYQGFSKLKKGIKDRRGMTAALFTTIFGPFVGVGFSLMALQYTSAGIASTLMATTPILILIPSHLIFHTVITKSNIIGAIISVFGVSLFFL
jgi:drug/metabolite transporter (DMT)-like permease